MVYEAGDRIPYSGGWQWFATLAVSHTSGNFKEGHSVAQPMADRGTRKICSHKPRKV